MLFRWMKHKDNRKQYPGIIYDNVRLNTGSICLMLKNFVPGCSYSLYNGFQLSVENNNVGLFEVRSTVRFVWFRKLSLNRSQPG